MNDLMLSDHQLHLLQPLERALKAGETLFAAGDQTRGFFVVRSGRVRMVRFSAAGRETALFTAGPGDRFAEASLFAETYHCDAVALTDSTVACFPKAPVLAFLRTDVDSSLALVADLARQVMELRAAVALRDIRSARARVLAYLVMKAGADGRTVAVDGVLKDVAAAVGLTPEAFYRTLAQLQAEGAIRRGEKAITLV